MYSVGSNPISDTTRGMNDGSGDQSDSESGGTDSDGVRPCDGREFRDGESVGERSLQTSPGSVGEAETDAELFRILMGKRQWKDG